MWCASLLAAFGLSEARAQVTESPTPAPTTPPDSTAAPAPEGTAPPAPDAPPEAASDETAAEPVGAATTDTAPAPAAPTAEADAAASTEEISAEEEYLDLSGLGGEASDVLGSGPQLDIYGFADFTYTHWLDNIGEGETIPTFGIGNFNVYLATDLGSNWRSLAEVRFHYVPNGAQPAGDFTAPATDTTVADPADFQRPLRWGGIEIERIWLEYSFDQLLTVRGGQWLTPYGVWNVDHGSPVIIAPYRPFIIGEALIPERQTGLELHGSGYLGSVKLGYHLTLSNGRGPVDAYADMDKNKAVGGRLFVEHSSSLGDLTVGASGYAGRYTRTQVALGAAGFTTSTLEEYRELGYAADLKWLFKGLHVQSEVIVQEVGYDDYRPADPFGRPGLVPDFRRWGGYVLVGYRTPFYDIMPYVNAEYYADGPAGIWGKIPAYWFGVNVRPMASVVLKAQYLYSPGGRNAFGEIDDFSIATAQASWSF